MPKKEAPFLRFMKSYEVCPSTGCWLWTGYKQKNGYGAIKAFGRFVMAHRFAHELYLGPIPPGLEILHSCDVKLCVNPDHIRAGTHAENMAEAADRGLMRSGENHPMYGRSFSRPTISNRVLVLGVQYDSQKQAERALGLGRGTVRYWIKNIPTKAKILSKGVN